MPPALRRMHLISPILSSLASMACRRPLTEPPFHSRKQIKVDAGFGFFATLRPTQGHADLPSNLRALLRPVALCAVDVAPVAQVLLATQGLAEAQALATRIACLYSLARELLMPEPQYNFGIATLRLVLGRMAELRDLQPSAGPEARVVQALWDVHGLRLLPGHARVFEELLADVFGLQARDAEEVPALLKTVGEALEEGDYEVRADLRTSRRD